MTQKRKRLFGSEKIAIVKRYLVERVPIADLCDEHGLQPSQIYRWQAAIFEHGADAFDLNQGRRAKAAESAKDAKIARLEAVVTQKDAKIAEKNAVISELMEEPEVETIVQRALEKHPGRKPRILSDNRPQFIAKDFKQFVRLAGIAHVRPSPSNPQSNGRLERWHKMLEGEEFRNKARGRSRTTTRCEVTRRRAGDHTYGAHVMLTRAVPCALTRAEDRAPMRTSREPIPGPRPKGRDQRTGGCSQPLGPTFPAGAACTR